MQTKWLKSFQMGVFLCLFATFSLTGCSTVEPTPPVIISNNNEKDLYITKVEEIVSDSASALVAISGSLPQGDVRQLTEAQVTRLSGLSKPSVAKVEYYSGILKQGDSKAIQRDKDEASKVDAETTELYAMVEQKDLELAEANSRADAEFKQKVLWQVSTAGLIIFAIGVGFLAFSPRKASGVILMLSGAGAIGSAWVFESPWFPWIAGAGVGFLVLDLLIIGGVKTYRYLRPSVGSVG